MAKNAVITGWGFYAPTRVVTNFDLEKIVETSDDWITSRTGIKERRFASDGENTSSMSVRAARAALDRAKLRPQDVQLIIVGTCSPDYLVMGMSAVTFYGTFTANGVQFGRTTSNTDAIFVKAPAN